MILTDDHWNLPIVKNISVLKLIARSGNFIPTPAANQLLINVRRSLNIFCIRVYRCFSKNVYSKLIEQAAKEAQDA